MNSFKTRVETRVMTYFKKLHEDAVLPYYATDGSAGMDCHTVSDAIIKSKYIAYNLGFAVQIPKGFVGLLFPRSSISKTDLMLANSVGVIDSDYRGEVQARFNYLEDQIADDYTVYVKGDAVCQLIIVPYPTIVPQWADELMPTERGEGGFGSTTK